MEEPKLFRPFSTKRLGTKSIQFDTFDTAPAGPQRIYHVYAASRSRGSKICLVFMMFWPVCVSCRASSVDENRLEFGLGESRLRRRTAARVDSIFTQDHFPVPPILSAFARHSINRPWWSKVSAREPWIWVLAWPTLRNFTRDVATPVNR